MLKCYHDGVPLFVQNYRVVSDRSSFDSFKYSIEGRVQYVFDICVEYTLFNGVKVNCYIYEEIREREVPTLDEYLIECLPGAEEFLLKNYSELPQLQQVFNFVDNC